MSGSTNTNRLKSIVNSVLMILKKSEELSKYKIPNFVNVKYHFMENKFGFGIIGMFPNHNPTIKKCPW